MYLERSNILYASVPKCACSALKAFCVKVEYGKPFKETELAKDGKTRHGVVDPVPFRKLKNQGPKGAWKFAVVRHPVDRVVSCYESKVLDKPEKLQQRRAQLEKKGLSLTPDLAEFVDRLEDYQSASNVIRKHSLPLDYFLGDNPEYFDRIYNFSEIAEVPVAINERAGTEVELLKSKNAYVKRLPSGAVTEELCRKILEKYRSDIEIFGPYLGPSKFAVANECTVITKRRPSWLRKSLNAVNRTLTSARSVTLTTARRR